MATQRKLAILLPDLRVGGAERVSVNIANECVNRGIDVEMVLLRNGGELRSRLDPRIRVIDLEARKIRQALKPLAAYLRSARPDGLVANMWPITSVATVARLLARVSTNLVLVEHTTLSASAESRSLLRRLILRIVISCTYRLATGVVAVSRGVADDLARVGSIRRDRIDVIYNPVYRDAVALSVNVEQAPTGWWSGSHPRILAVGSLKPAKDYPTLLRAVAALRTSVDVRLLILGEGPCRPELEQLVDTLGLHGHVFLHGYVAQPDPYYRAADVFVLSSRFEGLPTVLVEALAAGTSVVSTDCPSGASEILKGGRYGRLTPVGDPTALANAIADTLKEDKRPGDLICRAQDFGIDAAVDQYLNLLLPHRGRTDLAASGGFGG